MCLTDKKVADAAEDRIYQTGVTGLFAALDRKNTKGYTYHVNWGGMPIYPQNVVFRQKQERNY